MIEFNVTDQSITLINATSLGDTLVSNTENNYKCKFNFNEIWDGYGKTVVFMRNGNKEDRVSVLLDENDECYIPLDVIKDECKIRIGVYGKAENKSIPTVYSTQMMVRLGAIPNPEYVPEDPDEDVYGKLLEAYIRLVAFAETFKGGAEGQVLMKISAENDDFAWKTIEGFVREEDLNTIIAEVESKIPTKISDLENDSGYLTEETDPTVPEWAKQPDKPSYTASEVGALPDTTIIPVVPTRISAFENDKQYVTESFVNSSISTNTAYYISDNGQPFQSFEALQSYSGELTNNDYAFVVGSDDDGNTTYTRYKYNSSEQEWAKEYVLNNSSFTNTQWLAINSGITALAVEQIGINKDAISDMLTAISGKIEATNYATSVKGGTIKTGNGLQVSTTGTPSASTLTSTAYRTAANGYFISKGTLDTMFPSKFLTEIGKINPMTWNNLGEISVVYYPTIDDYLDELTTYNNGYFTYDGDTYFVHIYSDADEDFIGQSLWSDKTGIEHAKFRTGRWDESGSYTWSNWVQDGWIDLGIIDVEEDPYTEILDKLTKVGKFRFIDGGSGDYFHWFVQNEGDERVIGQSYWSTEAGIQYMNYRTGWISENGDVTWGDYTLFMSYEDLRRRFALINHNHDDKYAPKIKDVIYANGYDYVDLGEIDLDDYDGDYYEFINTLTETGNYRFVDNFDYFTWVVEVKNTDDGIGQSCWSTEEGMTAISFRWGRKTGGGIDWDDWQTWLTYDTAYNLFAPKGHNHRSYKNFETRTEFDAFLNSPVYENGELTEYICKVIDENKIYIVNCGYNNQSSPKRYVRYITYWCMDTPWDIRTRSSINTTTTYKWSEWHKLTDVTDEHILSVVESAYPTAEGSKF